MYRNESIIQTIQLFNTLFLVCYIPISEHLHLAVNGRWWKLSSLYATVLGCERRSKGRLCHKRAALNSGCRDQPATIHRPPFNPPRGKEGLVNMLMWPALGFLTTNHLALLITSVQAYLAHVATPHSARELARVRVSARAFQSCNLIGRVGLFSAHALLTNRVKTFESSMHY